MKTKLFTLFLALVASVGIAFASVTIDGISYNLDETNLTAEVTWGVTYSGNVVIPSQVVYNAKTYSVTSIGEYVFAYCRDITSVTIPNSVTSIGQSAFEECTGLTSATIGNSVTSIGKNAFYNCSSLTSVTIGNSVTSIGISAFYNCSSLTSVTLNSNAILSKAYSTNSNISHIFGEQVQKYIFGNSVTTIGQYAFSGCSSLTSITIPSSITNIGNKAFDGCMITSIDFTGTIGAWCSKAWSPSSVSSGYQLLLNGSLQENITLPNSVTSVGDYAFACCSSLKSVKIPNSVTNIGRDAFRKCSGLTSVTIGNGVTSIGNYAFYCCSGLTSVSIPNSVTSVGDYAFDGSGLTSVIIPNSVTSIGDCAFLSCSHLDAVYISDIAAWCAIDFKGHIAGEDEYYSYSNPLTNAKHLYLNNTEITDLVIPDGVASIGKYAFCVFSGLTSVTIANSVTSIGKEAFGECIGLTTVTIPNSVTNIGKGAFTYCPGLTSVTIGNGVTNIGDRAFSRCHGLTAVTCKAITPPQLGTSVFDTESSYSSYYLCENLYVPAESVEAYKKADGWKYFSYFSAITDDAVENVLSDDAQTTKVLRDGKVYILRGDKTYNLQGQEMK